MKDGQAYLNLLASCLDRDPKICYFSIGSNALKVFSISSQAVFALFLDSCKSICFSLITASNPLNTYFYEIVS